MRLPVTILLLLLLLVKFSLAQTYFNNVYNPMQNYARGRGIVAFNDHYYCLTNADDPTNTWQSFVWVVLDNSGEVTKQKLFHIPGHNLYPGVVGGTLKFSEDGFFYYAFEAAGGGLSYSSLIKFNTALDTIWKKDYYWGFPYTKTPNCTMTNDGGYILCGHVIPAQGEYNDLLLVKTDSLGNVEWYNTYGAEWSENGFNVIQTPDKGYLVGGYFWKPGYYHSLDAMVIKTDSLGNEMWTNYYGNPEINDGIAFVAQDDEDHFIMAFSYGELILSSYARKAVLAIYKIDIDGNVMEMKKFNPIRRELYLRNFKLVDDYFLVAGHSIFDTVSLFNEAGWIYKIDLNEDSIWRHEYQHFNGENAMNYLYDVALTNDNGIVAIGRSNESSDYAKMWVIKLDSLGCDTPGCNTPVIENEYISSNYSEIKVWPNPATNFLNIYLNPPLVHEEANIQIFNQWGNHMESFTLPVNEFPKSINVADWPAGVYYITAGLEDGVVSAAKFIVK